MQSFSIRDLRERSGALSQEIKQGKLVLVTRHGHPLFICLPFSAELLDHGVHVTLAVKLLRDGDISLGKAAKIAKMDKVRFIEYVSQLGIPVIDFDKDELNSEMEFLSG